MGSEMCIRDRDGRAISCCNATPLIRQKFLGPTLVFVLTSFQFTLYYLIAALLPMTTSFFNIIPGLADIMKRLLIKYDNLFEVSFPYSMGWHGK